MFRATDAAHPQARCAINPATLASSLHRPPAFPPLRPPSRPLPIYIRVLDHLWTILGFILSHGTIVTCHYKDACLGGADSACGVGYSGLRCGQCADGYFKLSQRCRQCFSTAESVTLVVLLAALAVLVLVFFVWQVFKDPRVGSPLVFVMKMLETLSILSLTGIDWPGSVATFLPVVSLVNFNTEMFQTECVLGRPHPTRGALMYIGGFGAALLIILLFWPVIFLWKRRAMGHRGEAGTVVNLESMCAPMHPDLHHPEGAAAAPLTFLPTQAILAATFADYIRIALAVRAQLSDKSTEGAL